MKWHKYPEERPRVGILVLVYGIGLDLAYWSNKLTGFVHHNDLTPLEKSYRITHWTEVEFPKTHEK